MLTPNLDEVLREYIDDGGDSNVADGANRELDVLQADHDAYTAVKNQLVELHASNDQKSLTIDALVTECDRMKQERDAWKNIVMTAAPDGFIQADEYSYCISCEQSETEGHAADCKFIAALKEGTK